VYTIVVVEASIVVVVTAFGAETAPQLVNV
jgi:hypothetical protein